MCFSAEVNFVGSAVLGGIGIATLTRVKHRRELLFASLIGNKKLPANMIEKLRDIVGTGGEED